MAAAMTMLPEDGSCVDLYVRSCNPPRRAKGLRSLPHTSYADPEDSLEDDATSKQAVDNDDTASSTFSYKHAEDVAVVRPAAAAPSKRGRKPSTMSRAVREAQRKLNHSIIEKARRTKINNALATLRQLVPTNYEARPKDGEVDDDEDTCDEDEEDEDGEYDKKVPAAAKKNQKKKSGEKGKEYKLEILIRAVSYMQDLVQKVDRLETQAALSSAANAPTSDAHGPLESCRCKKRKRPEADDGSEADTTTCRLAHSESLSLPPFSTLFATANIDPTLLPSGMGYLPSPPSSTQFRPITTTQVPPALVLDADSSSNKPSGTGHTSMSARTPEDEKAASLLLEISGSPPLAHSLGLSCMRLPSFDLNKESSRALSEYATERLGNLGSVKAQTPSSLLGMHV